MNNYRALLAQEPSQVVYTASELLHTSQHPITVHLTIAQTSGPRHQPMAAGRARLPRQPNEALVSPSLLSFICPNQAPPSLIGVPCGAETKL